MDPRITRGVCLTQDFLDKGGDRPTQGGVTGTEGFPVVGGQLSTWALVSK